MGETRTPGVGVLQRKDMITKHQFTLHLTGCRSGRTAEEGGASIALEPLTDSVINVTEGVPIGIITIEDVIEVRPPCHTGCSLFGP